MASLIIDGTYWIKDLEVPGQTYAANKSEKIVRKDSESLKEIVAELKSIHNKHNEAFKKQILRQLKEIPPQTFEVFAKRLLEVYGFIDMQVTAYVKDGGIDGHGKLKVGITF